MKAADSYWHETTGEWFDGLPGSAWIRLSTGKLCMDVGSGYESCIDTVRPQAHSKLPEVKLTEYDLGDKLLSTLELDEFYSLVACGYTNYHRFPPSISGTITLPSICSPCCPWYCVTIPTTKKFTPDDLYIQPWNMYGSPSEVLPTGWTWCAYSCFAPSFSNNCSVGLIIQSVTHVCSGSM
jgi:hypothetical protein